MMNKRGDITEYVVGLAIIIMSFGLLLLFLLNYSWTDRINKETCHESVVFRGTLPSIVGAKDFVPLKCKTEKTCITSGLIGGSCDSFNKSSGITKVKVNSENAVAKTIAGGVVDCWDMMGQGKLSVFSQFSAETYGVGKVYSTCVICSRIAFDNSKLQKARVDLSKVNVLDYMRNYQIPNKQMSYYKYIVGEGTGEGFIGASLLDKLPLLNQGSYDSAGNLIEQKEVDLSDAVLDEEGNVPMAGSPKGESGELGVVFMQISAPEYDKAFLASLTTLGLTGGSAKVIASKPTGFVLRKGVDLIKKYPVAALAVFVGAIGLQSYGVYSNQQVAAAKCGDLSTGDNARKGCSVVRVLPYNEESLKQVCDVIESIP